MTNRLLLTIAISSVLIAGVTIPALAIGSWQGEPTDSSADDKNKNTKILTLTATDAVPIHTGELAGFAWLYAGFDPSDNAPDAFGITTHDADLNNDGKNDVRDSLQKKDGWHPHNFILGPGGENSDLCVTEIVDAPTAGISIKNDDVKVNVRNSILLDEITDSAVAFAIVVDTSCDITVPTSDVISQEIKDLLGLDGLPLGILLNPAS